MGFFSNLFGSGQKTEEEKEAISLCVQELQPELEEARGGFKNSKGFEKALMSADVIRYVEGFIMGISRDKKLDSSGYHLINDVFIALTDEKVGNRMYQKLRALNKGKVKDAGPNDGLKYNSRGQDHAMQSTNDSPSYGDDKFDEFRKFAQDSIRRKTGLSALLQEKQG